MDSLWSAILDSVFRTIFASEIGRVLSAVVGLPGLLRGMIVNESSASTLVCVLKMLLYICVRVFDSVGDTYFKYSQKILSAPPALPLLSFANAFSVSSSFIGFPNGLGVLVLSNGEVVM